LHRDVALGFFAFKKREIDMLVSGKELSVRDEGCFAGEKQILKFSSSFRMQMDKLKAKGYSPMKATVRHVVFWQGKDEKNEVKIILPNIVFSKNS